MIIIVLMMIIVIIIRVTISYNFLGAIFWVSCGKVNRHRLHIPIKYVLQQHFSCSRVESKSA